MKKMVILMMILGVVSTANATLQISVGGDQEPIDSQITIAPSDELILDIWTDAQISAGVGEWYGWALAVDTGIGSISGGIIVPPADTEPGVAIFDDALNVLGIPLPPPENGVGGTILITGVIPNIPAGATIFDDILFHCEAPGDAIIHLYGTNDYVNLTLLDTVIIHQIPEPATIALLGLGGLLLRRKK